jgi:hypothetical protein
MQIPGVNITYVGTRFRKVYEWIKWLTERKNPSENYTVEFGGTQDLDAY